MRKLAIAVLATLIVGFYVASLHAGNAMPGSVLLDSITDRFEPVNFNHSLHTQMSENCSVCHHQHPISDPTACSQCHSITSSEFRKKVVTSFLSCQSCHGEFDKENPGMPGLKVAYHRTCLECHRGIGNVGLDPKGCTELCHAKRGE